MMEKSCCWTPPLRASAAVFVAMACLLLIPAEVVDGRVRRYEFKVVMKNVTLLCSTKSVVTVNGKFPGPTLYAREGDNVVIRVVNHVQYNVTVHWHGIRQLRTGWADGPAYITQCPITPGRSYVYNFTVEAQRGTLWWHAHILWLRATVHGALVVLPRRGQVPYYPFPTPYGEPIVLLAEWWKADVEAVIDEATRSGLAPNVSDTYLINGLPGDRPRHAGGAMAASVGCGGSFELRVKPGKTYLLRLVNAVLNTAVFFKVAGHRFTVVEVDAVYTKPFDTDTVFITPGQTTTVLLKADQQPGTYLVTASPFEDNPAITIDNTTATATLRYDVAGPGHQDLFISSNGTVIHSTSLPAQNATPLATAFETALRSLNSPRYPANVPRGRADNDLFFTVGMGLNLCPACTAGIRLVADINNLTFTLPTTALLQAHYFNRSAGVFTDDFPGQPPEPYNYTGKPPGNTATNNGTKVYRLRYNSTVQLVLQDTGMLGPENHPIHLHGFNVFVVGRGIGNYDPKADPAKFNLVDPVERNTVGVPSGGWTAIRFRADNPGVWFLHCHLEAHITWGLKMAFLVENGEGSDQSLLPPPVDLPSC